MAKTIPKNNSASKKGPYLCNKNDSCTLEFPTTKKLNQHTRSFKHTSIMLKNTSKSVVIEQDNDEPMNDEQTDNESMEDETLKDISMDDMDQEKVAQDINLEAESNNPNITGKFQ